MYMLKSVGDRTPPCGTPYLNWRCVDVLFLNVVTMRLTKFILKIKTSFVAYKRYIYIQI